MPRILFISTEFGWLAKQTAELCADLSKNVWDIVYCDSINSENDGSQIATSGKSFSLKAVKLHKLGKSLRDGASQTFDVVIQMNDAPLPPDLVFAGLPIRICWRPEDLDIPAVASEDELSPSDLDQLITQLTRKLHDLFADPLMEAGLRIRLTFGSLINHLTEGVMAHDRSRRIFLWNRTAELITGYSADEVIGRDCHEIFADYFCGGDCSFCTPIEHSRSRLRYPNSFVKRDGIVRDTEMSVVTLDTLDRGVIGALVIFRDTTELNTLRRQTKSEFGFQGMIGTHPSMQRVYNSIQELAHVNVPILIQGDSGTGKEMVAKALHEIGSRAAKPFVPVNCGALPEGTLESELFGHVRGAFTGAIRDKKGRFELADGGILFLDEIGEITPNLQVKLLRVLQESQFVPVGGEKAKNVDVQILCATNKNLKELTRQGLFREDLYYRLAVVPITLPSLCERIDDIPALVNYYLDQVSSQLGAERVLVSQSAMDILMRYPWPGNVRELRNAIQYGIIKTHVGIIQPAHLPPEVRTGTSVPVDSSAPGRPQKLRLKEVRDIMHRVDGNKAKAARLLGVSRTTLYKMLEQL